jgi:hypothetical protein
MAAVVVAGALAVGPVREATAAVPTGNHEIRSPWRPGECLQAGPNVNVRGEPALVMFPCDGGVRQRWTFEPTRATPQPSFQRVRSAAYGMCMDADNRGGRLTLFVHLFQCNDSPNQAWAFPEPGNQGVACVLAAPLCDLKLIQTTTQGSACLAGADAKAMCAPAKAGRSRVTSTDENTGPDYLAPFMAHLNFVGEYWWTTNDETWFVWPQNILH